MTHSLRTLLRPLAHLLPTGMTVPVLKGPLKGKKWIVGAAAGGGKGLSIIINSTEPEQLQHAVRTIHKECICFDIGANVGLYTLLFSQYAKAVYSFEPLPRNLMYLTRLVALNSMSNAHIIPCALSDFSGVARFEEDTPATGKLGLQGKVPVLVTTCDQFIADADVVPQVLKIDVEGAELSVLKGARNLLQTSHPSLLLSVHSDALREDCIAYLQALGYESFCPLNHADIHQCFEMAVHYRP